MDGTLGTVTAALDGLRTEKIHYRLTQFRESSIAVEVFIPGQVWEIEFFADGRTEGRKYLSNGEIFEDKGLIEELFKAVEGTAEN